MSKAADTTLEMTNSIIDAIAAGEGDGEWQRTWNMSGEAPTNALTKRAYTGMNRFWLSLMGINWIATNKQWKQLDAQVNWDNDPKPVGIPLLRPVFNTEKDDNGKPVMVNGKPKQRLVGFSGFTGYPHTEQTGWEAPAVETIDFTPIEVAEQLAQASGIEIRHGGDRAYYSPSENYVQMPQPETFHTELEYYRTLMHELVHATSHKDRLDRRDWVRKTHGTNAYAYEELIAEIGATFVCGHLGLGQDEKFRTNHVKYIKHWLDMMRGDSGIIVKAASQAEAASGWLLKQVEAKAKEVQAA